MKVYVNGKFYIEEFGSVSESEIKAMFLARGETVESIELVPSTVEELRSAVEKNIYKAYPQVKQNSDLADKMYFETTLKASGNYPGLESKIAQAVADFYVSKTSGTPKTPAELAASLAAASGDEVGIEQLIKVGIRVKWVQDCKAAYKAAAEAAYSEQPVQLELPDYPL